MHKKKDLHYMKVEESDHIEISLKSEQAVSLKEILGVDSAPHCLFQLLYDWNSFFCLHRVFNNKNDQSMTHVSI